MKNLPLALSLFVVSVVWLPAAAADRPNFVWLVSEDNSKHYLRLFDEHGAETPQIESLAQSGLVFDHAFSNSPVCSVARTTLISGCYAPRIGTQYHRRSVMVPMPDGLRMFPAYLREAGYFAELDLGGAETAGLRWTLGVRSAPPRFVLTDLADMRRSELQTPDEVAGVLGDNGDG